MASAAAVDGKSLDKNLVKSPILNSLHGRSPRQPHDKKQDDPMLAAADSAHHALPPPSDQSSPQEIVEYYTWKNPMPRLFVKHAPTTSTPASLLKWVNYPTRLNTSRDLEPRAVLLQQARQRVQWRRGIFPIHGGHVGLGTWLRHQACRQGVVRPDCHSSLSCLIESLHPISPEWFGHHSCTGKRLLALLQCVLPVVHCHAHSLRVALR